MSKKIKIKIDKKECLGYRGQTILEIAKDNDIFIPSLCYHPDLPIKATCRVCVVEVKGCDNLMTSCSVLAEDGIEVFTNSKKVKEVRDNNLKLIFAEHIEKCFNCTLRFGCSLLDLARRYGIKITSFNDRKGDRKTYKFANAVEVDGSQCIDCRNCVETCSGIQNINYLEIKGRGSKQEIVPTTDKNIDCIYCGQCALRCPVDSAQERHNWEEVESFLQNKKSKQAIAIIAPSTRMTIGEGLGIPYGVDSSGKMVAALKELGFDQVIDVNFAADITTLVEAEELLERINDSKAKMPMITSCCPAWIKYLEFYQPELIPHLTTSRSPQLHLGGIIKTYWAKKKNIDPKDIHVTSIMPCTAKKFEITRTELMFNKIQLIDKVLTVRELSFLIKKNNIDFKRIKPVKSNDLINDGSSAGLIFGASGGVMESALRTANKAICSLSDKNKLCRSRIEFKSVRGSKGVKEALVKLGDKKLRVAVVSGIGNVKRVLTNLNKYDYIEVMACPGGCIGGGGQPIPTSEEIVKKRTAGIYKKDKIGKIRTAHENSGAVDVLNWIKDNNLEKNILHTKYSKKIRK
jgi:iron-only hydrogenase group A